MLECSHVKAVVIANDQFGVFLAEFLGLGLWSRLSPEGLTRANAFPSAEIAAEYAANWEHRIEDLRYVEVDAVLSPSGDLSASRDACVSAGLPGWEVFTAEDILPPAALFH